MKTNTDAGSNFIRDLIAEDLRNGTHGGRVVTRFPPEPNGYLHIGHAKAITTDFGLAAEFGGKCHMRFDDTNPVKEDTEYVDSILRDVRWLGWDWGDNLFFASDYFGRMADLAEQLIRDGKAYVCSLTEEQMREYRGTVNEPSRPSPDRDRPIDENLALFRQMRAGELPDSSYTLRAKIDLSSPNMKMRDPPLYRIRHAHHHRTGDAWAIYPMYDYAHPLSDAIEDITHSICTLEFDNNRELYDWVVDNCAVNTKPRQYEFARLALTYTVMSKRKLLHLVQGKFVRGWDDPRMPTLAGLRRKGLTPEAIRAFCERVGVAKTNSTVDLAVLEHYVREDLNNRCPRRMAVLRPLRVVITNWPGGVEWIEAADFPAEMNLSGSRRLPMDGTLLIDREDFAEEAPKGFHRFSPDRAVRLRFGRTLRCTGVLKDGDEVREVHAELVDEATLPAEARPKATIHWVSEAHAPVAELRIYETLFNRPDPENGPEGSSFLDFLNPESETIVADARVEPSLAAVEPGARFQFERVGYFIADSEDHAPGRPVFNRTVALRDSFAKAPKEAAPVAELVEEDPAISAVLDAVEVAGAPRPAWLVSELRRELSVRGNLPFGGGELAGLVRLVEAGTLSTRQGREVLAGIANGEGSLEQIVEARGFSSAGEDAALAPLIDAVIARFPEKLEQYRGGRSGLLGFFVGEAVKAAGKGANPQQIREMVAKRLG